MMKILLLNPPSKFAKNVVRDLFYGCWCKGKRIASAKFPPTTLMSISAVLKQDGHEVKLVEEMEEADMIIVPTSSMTFKEDAFTLKNIKNFYPKTTTVAFGSHVTFCPEEAMKHVDYIVMREPEYIIRDLARGNKNVRGTGHKNKINNPYPFIKNLDELPFPDRELVRDKSYFNPLVKKLPWTTAITSRGCPGRCNFCTSPAFYGKTLRMRSPMDVVAEMYDVAEQGYNEIFYRDETFTANKQRVLNICKIINNHYVEMSWICSARIGTVNKDMMVKMKEAGCHMIRFGVESGNQQILNNINKGITVGMTRKTFKWANEIGMETHAHVMLGCVGESWKTVNQTIQFVKDIKPTTVTFGAYTPYPGTDIYNKLGLKDLPDLSTVHDTGYHSEMFSQMTSEEVGEAVHKAYREFYRRPSYILGRLWSIRSLNQLRQVVSAGLDVLSYAYESSNNTSV